MKANGFSEENVSYWEFVTVVNSLRTFVETKGGYQQRSSGIDPGGPSLPIRGKTTRFRARVIGAHFIQELPKYALVKQALRLSESR